MPFCWFRAPIWIKAPFCLELVSSPFFVDFYCFTPTRLELSSDSLSTPHNLLSFLSHHYCVFWCPSSRSDIGLLIVADYFSIPWACSLLGLVTVIYCLSPTLIVSKHSYFQLTVFSEYLWYLEDWFSTKDVHLKTISVIVPSSLSPVAIFTNHFGISAVVLLSQQFWLSPGFFLRFVPASWLSSHPFVFAEAKAQYPSAAPPQQSTFLHGLCVWCSRYPCFWAKWCSWSFSFIRFHWRA